MTRPMSRLSKRARRILAALCAAAAAALLWRPFEAGYSAAWRRSCGGPPAESRGFDLYAVGDSTPGGAVYGRRLSFPFLVSRAFGGRVGELPIRLTVLAKPGDLIEGQRQAFERTLLCRNAARPGAVLVYAGHNDRLGPPSLPLIEEIKLRWLYRLSLIHI